MFPLFNKLNQRAEGYKGKRLIRLLAYIFFGFLIVGLAIGYIAGAFVDDTSQERPTTTTVALQDEQSYQGTITFIEPLLHPEDEISYVLVGGDGQDIILLKSKDQILEVSEGHFTTVYGVEKRGFGGENYLLVDRVVITNDSN